MFIMIFILECVQWNPNSRLSRTCLSIRTGQCFISGQPTYRILERRGNPTSVRNESSSLTEATSIKGSRATDCTHLDMNCLYSWYQTQMPLINWRNCLTFRLEPHWGKESNTKHAKVHRRGWEGVLKKKLFIYFLEEFIY